MEPTISELQTYMQYLLHVRSIENLRKALESFSTDLYNSESPLYKYYDWDDQELSNLRELFKDLDVSTLKTVKADFEYHSDDEGGSEKSINSLTLNFENKKSVLIDDWETCDSILDSVDAEAFDYKPLPVEAVKPFVLTIDRSQK
jgi:hypothetical protein